jgi:hypothetical protein
MTWNEFKRTVDELLIEKGLTGDIEIDWIDVSLSTLSYTDAINVNSDDQGKWLRIT